MMDLSTVLLVGFGKMGSALARSWWRKRWEVMCFPFALHVVEPDAKKRASLAQWKVTAHADLADLPDDFAPGAILLAVEPSLVPSVTAACRRWCERDALLVSIAAGVRLATLKAALPETSRLSLVRVMPNIPATIGAGMAVACAANGLSQEGRKAAEELLLEQGALAWVEDEAQMDAVTAVSGCGPAYVFAFADALRQAAEEAALPPDLARQLAMETVAGAGRMLAQEGADAAELCRRVATPGGATAAALEVLRGGEDALRRLLEASVSAARHRAEELGKTRE